MIYCQIISLFRRECQRAGRACKPAGPVYNYCMNISGGSYMICIAHLPTPLGTITLSAQGKALTGLWFDGQAHFGSVIPKEGARECSLPVFEETERWLSLYFSGRDPGFTPPVELIGTPWQKAVWEILLTIPYGQTISYGAIAAALTRNQGRRTDPRAVGGAVSRNPISLIVPCHRVLGADGSLTGYAGGLERKRALLALEGAVFRG